MLDVAEVTSAITAEFSTLVVEVRKLAEVFRETQFLGEISNLPNAHDGYLMVCFSKIDWLSQLAYEDSDQTLRMQTFIEEYMHPGKSEEQIVSIHIFRHKLMHTGNIRVLYNTKSNIAYNWRLHWDVIPGNRPHFSISEETQNGQEHVMSLVKARFSKSPKEVRVINISLVELATDLKRACLAYLSDLSRDRQLQARYQRVMRRHQIGAFKM